MGIIIGLYSFDINNIDTSIENLIGGLKTAFITSFAGVFAAICLKYSDQHKGNKEAKVERTDNELLREIAKNLCAENGKSLPEQIDLMRTDNNTNNEKLVSSIDEFASKVAKNQTEELVKALEKVLGDLEKTIQEKLGESFKQFGESVDNLVKWQEGYKDNIDQTQNILNKTKESITETASSFREIAEQNKEVQKIQEKLSTIIETLFDQLKSISEASEMFSKIPSEFQSIASDIESMKEDLKGGSEEYNKLMKGLESQRSDFSKELDQHLSRTIDGFRKKIEETLKELSVILDKKQNLGEKNG